MLINLLAFLFFASLIISGIAIIGLLLNLAWIGYLSLMDATEKERQNHE